MTTQEIIYTVPSNGWTGSIDVTQAVLDTDLSVFDIDIFYNSILIGTTELSYWSKVSNTSLSYSGSTLNQNDLVTIRRNTPLSRIQVVSPLQTISSAQYNAEFDRIIRRDDEFRTFGLPSTSLPDASVSDAAYGVAWNGVPNVAPSKNAMYDKIESLSSTLQTNIDNKVSDSVYGAGWNGVLDVAPSKNAVYDKIESVVSDTAYGAGWNGVSNVAPSQNAVYDKIEAVVSAISADSGIAHMSGRLTNASGVPIPTTTATGSTIYYTPYLGNTVTLYNGSSWVKYSFTSEISIALGTVTVAVPYDIFIYDNGGTLTLEKVAWTNYNTRATNLVLQNGIYCKSGALTRRYLGTVAGHTTTSTMNTSNDIRATYDGIQGNTIWNYYNRIKGVVKNTIANGAVTTVSNQTWFPNYVVNILTGLPICVTHIGQYGTGLLNGASAYMNFNVYDVNASSVIETFTNYLNYAVGSNQYCNMSWAFDYLYTGCLTITPRLTSQVSAPNNALYASFAVSYEY